MQLDFNCYKALQARDARFDGWFFVGVKTTGIYCRPVCPARTPQARHCVFVATAAQAERAGYRPCLRCRPELAPLSGGGLPLEQALFAAIRAQAPQGESVEKLADLTGFSARQLRRLVFRAYGVTPVEILQTERLLFAKKLLQETALPVMDIALNAGFGSLRRFNALFQARYQLSLTALRRGLAKPARPQRPKRTDNLPDDALTLRLAYRPPLAWRELLRYLARRAVPGVEWIDADAGRYGRTLTIGEKTGWAFVAQSTEGHSLEVKVPPHSADGLWTILTRLRALFDLDANPRAVDEHLGADPLLVASVQRVPGLRVPGAWDVFELAVRAVLGQQVSVAGATTVAGRLAARYGVAVVTPFEKLCRLAPSAHTLATTPAIEIVTAGMPLARAQTIRDLAEFAERGELNFGPTADMEEVIETLRRVRGIGEWTAQYIAMRALRFPDAFPAADLGLRKALAPAGQKLASESQTLQQAAAWRPWRAYATLRLWHSLEIQPTLNRMPTTYFTELNTSLGTLCLLATEQGLTGLFMEEHRHGPSGEARSRWVRDDARFADARAQLTEYFAGGRTTFDLPLDREAIGGTAFQKQVWAALADIPYGETITYGELARRIGQPAAVRAVGLANGRNPVSIIVPCHRVIGSGGALTGYGGGMSRKRLLLDLESRERALI